MSAVMAVPELIGGAATDVAAVGSSLDAARLTAASATTAVLPAAADEVSTGVAAAFSRCAQGFQAVAGQASAFQEQFVQHLTASATSYAGAEATNVGVLQPLDGIVGSIRGAWAALQSPADLFTALQRQVLALVATVHGALLTVLFGVLGALVLLFIVLLFFTIAFASAASNALYGAGY